TRPPPSSTLSPYTTLFRSGHERKTSGSYYTPSSLVELVLDEALDPVLDRAESADDPVAALLDVTVCDPACGSGHFLIATARRIRSEEHTSELQSRENLVCR